MSVDTTANLQAIREHVWQWLEQQGELPATLSVLMKLYANDHDAFFDLAVAGVPDAAPPWAREIAELAAVVRRFVRYGFRLDETTKQIIGAGKSLYLGDSEFAGAREFLKVLAGAVQSSKPGRDYVGAEISAAEIRFAVGTEEEYLADKARSSASAEMKPRLLQLSEQDQDAVRHGMPAYVVHELKLCGSRVVQAPTIVFQGLRLSGPLKAGRAYCGKPRRASDNDGNVVPPLSDMVYCVYADPEGYVFDWDWVPEDPGRPGFPEEYRQRFANQIAEPTEAFLQIPPDLVPSPFKKQAWHSKRGDCMFFYASDSPAFAKRVNDNLTEYRAFGSSELVGCKVKNFSELISRVVKQPSTGPVRVSAVLIASLVRQMEEHQEREKSVFIKVLCEAALQMTNKQRDQFLKALAMMGANRPERYLDEICEMARNITNDPMHPLLTYANEVISSRRAVEERYQELIAVAGNTEVRELSNRL